MPPLPLTPRMPIKAIGVNKTLFKPGQVLSYHHHPSPLQHKEKRKYDSLK
jgi:quercetin dioxygenase-like cupin family protein